MNLTPDLFPPPVNRFDESFDQAGAAHMSMAQPARDYDQWEVQGTKQYIIYDTHSLHADKNKEVSVSNWNSFAERALREKEARNFQPLFCRLVRQ